MIKEDKTDQTNSKKHGEDTSIIRISSRNEAFIFVVTIGSNGNGLSNGEEAVTLLGMVDFERIHTIDIWNCKPCFVETFTLVFEINTDIRLCTNKFKNNRLGIKRYPFSIL
jgi:hypothetical protein